MKSCLGQTGSDGLLWFDNIQSLHVYIYQRFPICGGSPGEARVVCMRGTFILSEIWKPHEIYIVVALSLSGIFHLPLSTGLELQAAQCVPGYNKLSFFYRNTRIIKIKWRCCRSSYCFRILCRRKELLHFWLHIHSKSQYSIPFPFRNVSSARLRF
jgi:hypothetical protein